MTIPHDNHIFWPWLTPVLQVSFWVLGAVPTFAGALGTCTGRSEGRAVAHFRSRGAKKGGWESLEDWPNTTTLKRNMEGLVYYIYKYIYYMSSICHYLLHVLSTVYSIWCGEFNVTAWGLWENTNAHSVYDSYVCDYMIWYVLCLHFFDILMLDLI